MILVATQTDAHGEVTEISQVHGLLVITGAENVAGDSARRRKRGLEDGQGEPDWGPHVEGLRLEAISER